MDARPVAFLDLRKYVNKARKNKLLSEDALSKAIDRGIRRSLRRIKGYAQNHHRYNDWVSRARASMDRYGGDGGGITNAIHTRTKKEKKSIQSGEIYISLREAPWAKYQYFGTEGSYASSLSRPLRFFGRRYNPTADVFPTKEYYTKMKVKGIQADPFLDAAVEEYRRDISEYINIEISKELHK